MLKIEGEFPGLDNSLPCHHENGFEPNSLFSNVTRRDKLGTLSDIADSGEILIGKSVFIALYNDATVINMERNKGIHRRSLGS